MKTQAVQKQITFSPELYELVQKRAQELGVSVAAYIRQLVASDVTEQGDDIPMVDEETEKMIGKSLEDIKKGRYTTIKTTEELKAYLNSL